MDNDFYKDILRKIFVKIFVVCEGLKIGTVEVITAYSFKVEFTLHHFHESSYIDVSFCIIYITNIYQYLCPRENVTLIPR